MTEMIVYGAVLALMIELILWVLWSAFMPKEKDEPVDALWWQMGDEIYTDPCETCHRWSECHGVDQENCPLWKKGEKHERKI